MQNSFLGLDIGAETIKIVILNEEDGQLTIASKVMVQHHKNPYQALQDWLKDNYFTTFVGGAATGRLANIATFSRIPVSAALAAGALFLHPEDQEQTIVSIGSRGFGVLEMRPGQQKWRENSRCSQGTGNFLRQLTQRFSLEVADASSLVESEVHPAALSGRCPVILKTDMTHLANKGESKTAILAGLFDAVAENVLNLIKCRQAPAKVRLVGGVSQSRRIRNTLKELLAARQMELLPYDDDDALYYEAVGAAVCAYKQQLLMPENGSLFHSVANDSFTTLDPLKNYQSQVRRLTYQMPGLDGAARQLILGFDMGSTGSKLLAFDNKDKCPVWYAYRATNGDPFVAALELLKSFLEAGGRQHQVVGFGVTGSGREIVGSLLKLAFGEHYVYIINEIAAHAAGALYYDPAVDTIFEIGGQDAKYIRLDHGQVFDAAMNEACSAGTGSFLEEQGTRLDGITGLEAMNNAAMAADTSVSLGQHCSVFMAENIDAAIAAGYRVGEVVSGLYDSVIQNYLNRVKGNRSVGRCIFCQGMPFAAPALGAAVARRTKCQVVVPPNPGVIGCLGIAILTQKELPAGLTALDVSKVLGAKLVNKDVFVCKSQKGCGGSGNHCRIDRLTINLDGQEKRFVWGGSCSLYDRGTQVRKLPDLAPDPFVERRQLLLKDEEKYQLRGRPIVAMTREFILSNLYPFFREFIYQLGFDLLLSGEGTHDDLKRGIEAATVPYCAPLQLYIGINEKLLAEQPDYLFLPMIRDLPRAKNELYSVACPLSQASGGLLKFTLGQLGRTKLLRPIIDMGQGNLQSQMFRDSCRRLATSLGVNGAVVDEAFSKALECQQLFNHRCLQIGQKALDFAKEHQLTPVVVIGRSYTIYNDILNSNVPSILRGQGTIAIPLDCYPVPADVPVYNDVFWGYSQQAVRAAHHIRRQAGVYSVFCSNYSCGPDSFTLQFYSYIMENKPFAIIETDGHSGDAGTKTRIEAFLSCVASDADLHSQERHKNNFKVIETDQISLKDTIRREEILLIPRMGHSAEVVAAVLRGEGIRAECLPIPDKEALELGRQHTSGKECLPMIVTLGSLLKRVLQGDEDDRFAFFMPLAHGPCRLGCYNLLDKIVFEKMGLKDRIRTVSQPDYNYFEGLSTSAALKILAAFVAGDVLWQMLYDVRPVELSGGAAQMIFQDAYDRLLPLLSAAPAGNLAETLANVQFGDMFGLLPLLKKTADNLAAVKDFSKKLPVVSVTGEIYVRNDPFANDFVVDELEKRGLKVKFSVFSEWMEYIDWAKHRRAGEGHMPTPYNQTKAFVSSKIQAMVYKRLYEIPQRYLKWEKRTTVSASLDAADPYMCRDLYGETCLTIGGPLHEYSSGQIAGVVSLGPLECMPSKVAEACLEQAGQNSALVIQALQLNGDPVDLAKLDAFAYEVRKRWAQNRR